MVLITKNSYDADVRNGDIGKITEVNEQPTEEGACGVLEINGRSLWITEDLLSKMSLGYAVTIHKSQGSEWQNVIVVLNKAGASMMDKTMLYTAATRAKQKLVICSNNEASIADAVKRGSLALNRNVNLDHFLIL